MQINIDSIMNSTAERTLIACSLYCFSFRDEILLNVTHTDFQNPLYRMIFKELEQIKKEKLLGDYFLIADRLKKEGVTLEDLENLISYANYEIIISEWIVIVKKYSAVRATILQIQNYLKSIIEDPMCIESERNKFIKKQLELPMIQKIVSTHISELLDNYKDGKSFVEYVKEQMEKRINSIEPEKGINWGYPKLDEYTSGIQKGHLIIVGARPAVGKTTFILNIISNIVLQQKNTPILLISLEMTKQSITTKLLSISSNISQKNIETGYLYKDQYLNILKYANALEEKSLYLIDESLYISEIVSTVRELIRTNNIKLVFIDYLGLIRNKIHFESKVSEVSFLTRELKCLAKDNDISVVCLSQLSRASEKEGRKPNKSDLRDSGQIEADADTILLLHQDHNFEVIIEKNRFGPTGTLSYNFDKENGKIKERP